VIGWDAGRLSMILAVLEARCGVSLTGNDVFLNVAGGLRVTEPAADLAVAAAILSAHRDAPIPHDAVVFGEISLSSAIRAVSQTNARLKEAKKLGFTQAYAPSMVQGQSESGMTVAELSDLDGLMDLVTPNGP